MRALVMTVIALAVLAPDAHAQLPAAQDAAGDQAKRDEADRAVERAVERAADARIGTLPAPPVHAWRELRWRDVPDAKSPGGAFAISAGATGAGVLLGAAILFGSNASSPSRADLALSLAPLVIAPSIGHFYTYDARTFLWLAVRAAGVAMITESAGGCAATADVCVTGPQGRWLDVGVALLAGGILADLVTAPGSAVRYNESHHDVVVAPFGVRDGWGLGAMGTW
ncbi:MAG TPA: hypothetical protein VGM88_12120 [Kofleriaceae bacterium]|jgi:hypothetical protein